VGYSNPLEHATEENAATAAVATLAADIN